MEKRVLGIALVILGLVGIILAGYHFMYASKGTTNVKSIILYGVLGFVFFGSGIGLIKNTSDKPS